MGRSGLLIMDLLLQLQEDVTDRLNSESAFQYNSVASLRRMVIAKEIEKRLPHLTKKNGKRGCGILVGMPNIEAMLPNVTPPQGDLLLPIDVVENPEMNFGPTGTQITCEQCARSVRASLHLLGIANALTLYQDAQAFRPLDEHELPPQCAGYRVLLRGRLAGAQMPKCVLPTLTEGPPLTFALTTTDAGASIYYTVDGSFPGPGNGTGSATLYAAPFAASNGVVLRWACYLPGYFGSDVGYATISA
jgi:hypothetical protein